MNQKPSPVPRPHPGEARLKCECSNSARGPTRQISAKCPTLLVCVPSLRELIETKHAHCIAAKLAEDEAAVAAAARKQNLGCLGTMIEEAAAKKGAAKRRTAELEAARELRNTTTLATAEAEALAESARRDEAEHAAPCVAKRNAAEEEAVVAARAGAGNSRARRAARRREAGAQRGGRGLGRGRGRRRAAGVAAQMGHQHLPHAGEGGRAVRRAAGADGRGACRLQGGGA